MTESELIDFVGYAAGVLLMWSFLPQVIKTARTGTTDGLSVGMLGITFASGVLYEVYAAFLGLTPVLVMNGVSLLILFVQLVLTLRINRVARRRASEGSVVLESAREYS